MLAADWAEARKDAIAAFQGSLFQEAADKFRATIPLAENQQQIALTEYELGVSLHGASRPREALQPLREAIQLWRTAARDDAAAAQAADALAACERNLGDYEGSAKTLKLALQLAKTDEVKNALRCALADLLREQGRGSEALALFAQGGESQPLGWQRKYDVLTGMGDVHRDMGEWSAALEEWRQAAEIARAHSKFLMEAIALRGEGETWLSRGQTARAEPLLRKALSALEADGSAGLQLASTLTSLSQVYVCDDKLAMGQDALERAIQIDSKLLGDRHPQMGVLLRFLGDVESRRGDFESGRAHMSEALSIMTSTFGESSPVTASVVAQMGVLEQRASRYDVAAVDFRNALEVLSKNGAEAGRLRAQVLNNYAAVLRASHRKAEANAVMAEARSFGAQGR